uniref:Uncharacterized protein n=1 Tax=Thermocrinis ruber TaxID=75906 RepID=A0A7C5X4D4_9AQUI
MEKKLTQAAQLGGETQLEFVGIAESGESVIRIFRQFDSEMGFKYFIEKNGELQVFDAFGEKSWLWRFPYPLELDWFIDGNECKLKVYEVEDLSDKIGGMEVREWCEKALQYYEGEEEGFWKEYWGLLAEEREILFDFFVEFFKEKENISKKEQWKVEMFIRRVVIASLGEYRDKLADEFIEHLLEYAFPYPDYPEPPKNSAKALLLWLDRFNGDAFELMDGLVKWDYLTYYERKAMRSLIYNRLLERAEKEEDWAGLSEEEWVELLKEKLLEEKVIKDDVSFWKWIKRRIEKDDMYELLSFELKGNADWDWMPYEEKKELAEAVEEYIREKLKGLESTA